MKKYGLTRSQWQLLLWLCDLELPCTQQELLRHFEIDAAHLTRLLEQLEQGNILVRERLPNNRRAQAIHVTPTGKKLLLQIKQIAIEQTNLLLEGLSTVQRNELYSLLDKIEHNLNQLVN